MPRRGPVATVTVKAYGPVIIQDPIISNNNGLIVKTWETKKSELSKERGGTIVLCANCGFQRGDLASTPGLVRESTRRYLPLSPTSSAKLAFSEYDPGTTRRAS